MGEVYDLMEEGGRVGNRRKVRVEEGEERVKKIG